MLTVNVAVSSLVGWGGTLCYLLAYFLLSVNKLKAGRPLYHVLNIAGALGLTYNALRLNDYPNIIVNIAWALIAGWAIFRIQARKS
jgi:hypothetical protein